MSEFESDLSETKMSRKKTTVKKSLKINTDNEGQLLIELSVSSKSVTNSTLSTSASNVEYTCFVESMSQKTY